MIRERVRSKMGMKSLAKERNEFCLRTGSITAAITLSLEHSMTKPTPVGRQRWIGGRHDMMGLKLGCSQLCASYPAMYRTGGTLFIHYDCLR